MPRAEWQRPRYDGCDVLELETPTVGADVRDELVQQWEEHVLMLTFQQSGVHERWGMAWLARNGNEPWHQVVRIDGPSPSRGDSERKLIREFRERITGRMS